MAAPVVPSLIVNELLNKHNSGDWRVRVKTYLVAKGLWSVVSEATEPRLKAKDKLEAWKKTNAEALHAIHLCCGNDAFKVIRDEESAHKAWKALIFHYPGDDHTSNNGNTEKAKEVVEDAETEKEAIEGDDHTSYIGNTEITTEVVKGAETEKKAIEGDDHTSNDGNTKIEKEVVGDAETEKEAIEGDDHTSNEGNIEIAKEVVEDAETGTEAIEGDDHISNKGNIEIAKEVVEDAETGKEAIEGDDHTSNDGNTDIAKEVVEDAETEKEAIEGDGGGDENSSNDDNKYNPFFNALKHLKWNSVMAFLKQYPEAISKAAPSSDDGKTVLHYAVDAGKVDIVESLLTFVKKDDDLEIMDNKGYSALDYCYMVPEKDETVEIAKRLLHKKAKLLKREVDPEVILSLFVGAHLCRRQKLADYLYKDTPLGPDDPLAAHLVSLSFSTKRFGIACDLIQKYPSLAITQDFSCKFPLNELACTPSAFLSGSRLKFWEKLIYHDDPTQEDGKGKTTPTPHAVSIYVPTLSGLIRSATALFQGLNTENICKFLGIHRIYQMRLNHDRSHEILVCMCKVLTTEKMKDCDPDLKEFVDTAIFQAAERGLVEFLTAIFRVNPDLAIIRNENDSNLFQVAVKCRQAKVYNLIHGFNKDTRKAIMSKEDEDGNNMLHMVGLFSPFAQTNCIRGAALQMQKELQWFKKLESMASPEDLEAVNMHDMKPRDFFSKNHEEMVKEAEKSMKETATSCTVVCTLIVTIMFAAAFTVPGGNNEDDGIPKFLNTRAFRVFIVADALSLFTSTTSVMLFLGILTSRYAEEDFLKSLPRKMILGLLTLFLSVTAMMIAFTSALFLMLPTDSWIAFPTTLLAGIPIASFIWMQFPFLVEIFISTYIPRTFRKNVNEKLNLGRVRFRDAMDA